VTGGLAVGSTNAAILGCPGRNRYSLRGAKGLFPVSYASDAQMDLTDPDNLGSSGKHIPGYRIADKRKSTWQVRVV